MQQTIAAIATPPGQGGVGIIRVSGPNAFSIATQLTDLTPVVKQVQYATFCDTKRQIIDTGLLLAFKGPHSFTGEDVIECQIHGGPVIMDMLLSHVVSLGARLAEPGEFSKRAFLNDKIDLVQAEAIADLIEAQSTHAARLAQHSLQGVFSDSIHGIVKKLIAFRTYIEAALDFPEEEIDFIGEEKVKTQLSDIIQAIEITLVDAKKGAVLREGIDVVICGKPNAGKSTLMNQLSGEETAIVTDIPGTTRDIVREKINIDGLILHVSDTAGLRDSDNVVEKEGIKRAAHAILKSTLALLVIDGSTEREIERQITAFKSDYPHQAVLVIVNKIDLMSDAPHQSNDLIYLSAKKGAGITELKQAIRDKAGLSQLNEENAFLARRRHIVQLEKALDALKTGETQLSQHRAGELLAEDCRLAQEALSDITGEFTSDDLLGHIFSSFCIGK